MLLHWKEDEGLYESDTTGVPVGEHICQLAVGGDVVPTEPFEVNEDSDVIFIIIGEGKEVAQISAAQAPFFCFQTQVWIVFPFYFFAFCIFCVQAVLYTQCLTDQLVQRD